MAGVGIVSFKQIKAKKFPKEYKEGGELEEEGSLEHVGVVREQWCR